MLPLLRPFIFPNASAIKFAIKLSIAAVIALYIAFCLDLEQPQWAAATSVIVAQPQSGMVISKGLARLLGTLLGTVMALLLTSLFSQTPWLFIFAMGLGLTLCTAASTVIRSAWSYAFVLGGYTTAIIVLPDIYKPLSIFDYAIARCTEICLGIICTSVIFAILWPSKVYQGLINEASKAWYAGLASACSALKGNKINDELLDSLAKIVAVDTQREHAAFEGGDGRNRAKAIQSMIHDVLGLLRAARGVSRQWKYLSNSSKEQLQSWLDESIEKLTVPTYNGLNELVTRLRETIRTTKDLGQQDILVRLEILVNYALSAGQDLTSVHTGKLRKKAAGRYLSIHRDYSLGLLFGLRSGLAFIILAFFWILWAWPINEASSALMMVGVICSMFANRENATQISMGFLRGVCYAVIVSFVVSQLILPSLTGFPLLWLAIGLPLFFSSLGMVNPAIAGTCTVFSINLVMLCRPENHGFQATESFINQGIAMPLGIIAATLSFHLVKINTSYWQGKYMLNAMLRDLRKLTQSSIGGAETWFGGRMADRLILLARHRKIMAKYANERWRDALHAMDIGDELLYLRFCLIQQKKLQVELQNYLDVLSNVFENEPSKNNINLLDKASDKFREAILAISTDSKAQLALSSIIQLQQIWQDWCQQQTEQESFDYGTA